MVSQGLSKVLSKDDKNIMYKKEALKLCRETSQAAEVKLYDFCQDLEKFIKRHAKEIINNKLIYNKIKNICKHLDIDLSYCLNEKTNKYNINDRIGEKIIDICRILRRQGNGMVDVQYCLQLLKPRYPNITVNDIIASIKELSVLGTIELQEYGHRHVINSIYNIQEGVKICLDIICKENLEKTCININKLIKILNWDAYAAINCLELLISCGYVWIDICLSGNQVDEYYKLLNNNKLADLNKYYEDIYLYTLT